MKKMIKYAQLGSMVVVLAVAGVAQAEPVTVKSCNRNVTFEDAPQRAISNDVNLTEMMLALKLQDRMERGSVAGRRKVKLARIGLGVGDELGNALGRHRRVYDHGRISSVSPVV